MDNKQNRRKSISSIANVAQALSLGHRRLHCKLLVTDALECKALNCYVPTALLCTQWRLTSGSHWPSQGSSFLTPWLSQDHHTPAPGPARARPRSRTASSWPALPWPPSRPTQAGWGTQFGACWSWNTCCTSTWPGVGTPWPQLRGSPGAEIHRLELVRRDHGHHVGMVGRSEVFLKI